MGIPKYQFDRILTVSIGAQGGAGLLIKDVRISAQITKTSTGEPNSATISIYNLSETTRNKLNKLDALVYVEAGYIDASNKDIVFAGTVISVTHTYPRPDVVTVIKAGDGCAFLRKSTFTKSYTAGTSAKKVLEDSVASLNLPDNIKALSGEIIDKALQSGFAAMADSKSTIDKMTRILGLTWSIQNNQFKVVSLRAGDKTRTVRLTPETGLIGSPEKTTDITLDTSNESDVDGKQKKYSGWKIKCLLMPKAEPGGILELSSRDVPKATYKIISVDHQADNFEGDFITEMTVMLL